MYLFEAAISINFWSVTGLIALGIFLGVVTTIGGIGGGPLKMPIFLLIFMYSQNIAKGTSIFLVFVNSGIAAIQHYRNKKTHLPSMLLISLVSSLGSITCFLVEPFFNIDLRLFTIIFGVFELLIALRMFYNSYKAYKLDISDNKLDNKPLYGEDPVESAGVGKGELHKNHIHNTSINIIKNPKTVWKALPLFFLAGFLAAFLGIGGGPINTPVLYEIVKLPIYNATAGSTTIIFFNSIVNVIIYGIRGDIDWVVGLIMGAGMMVGAFIGAKKASNVPRWATLGLLAVLLVIAGVKMITG